VLTEENIEALFGVKTELVQTPSGNTLIHYLRETASSRRIRSVPLTRTQ
jgi:ribosomal protein L34E